MERSSSNGPTQPNPTQPNPTQPNPTNPTNSPHSPHPHPNPPPPPPRPNQSNKQIHQSLRKILRKQKQTFQCISQHFIKNVMAFLSSCGKVRRIVCLWLGEPDRPRCSDEVIAQLSISAQWLGDFPRLVQGQASTYLIRQTTAGFWESYRVNEIAEKMKL